MALFLGLHTLQENMGGGWSGYKKSCEELGCRALHSYYSTEKGVGYCITEAPSLDMVREAHEKAGVPFDDIFEVGHAE